MPPNKNKGDLVQGTLDMLILRTLQRDAMHGFAIAKSIEARSEDVLRVEEGSLYPALYRLELQGLVNSEWGHAATGHRAKYYRLTSAGRKRLAAEQASWARVVRAIAKVMEPAEEAG
jgi:transcriptional regulator